jgi:ketosteroid isomerase-like protein
MSQENVELVRRMVEAYRRGDRAEALACLAPDVVYKVAQEAPAHGPEAVEAIWDRWEDSWEEIETIPEEVIDGGRDHVLSRSSIPDAAEAAGSSSIAATLTSTPSATANAFARSSSRIGPRPLRPPGCLSSDVAGERGDRQQRIARL